MYAFPSSVRFNDLRRFGLCHSWLDVKNVFAYLREVSDDGSERTRPLLTTYQFTRNAVRASIKVETAGAFSDVV
jgi:hypothetical protein